MFDSYVFFHALLDGEVGSLEKLHASLKNRNDKTRYVPPSFKGKTWYVSETQGRFTQNMIFFSRFPLTKLGFAK